MIVKKCLNCSAEVAGRFCPDCGQNISVTRLNLRQTLAQAGDQLLALDSVVPRTILELSRNPGRVCREYVDGRRGSYVQPFRYCLSALAFLMIVYAIMGRNSANYYFQADPDLSPEMLKFRTETLGFVLRHLNLIFLMAIPVTTLFLKGLYRRSRFNYAETMSFLLYVMGHNFLIGTIIAVVAMSFPQLQFGLRFLLQVVYLIWASLGFFDERWFVVAFKSVVAISLNFLTIGTIIALLIVPSLLEVLGAENAQSPATQEESDSRTGGGQAGGD